MPDLARQAEAQRAAILPRMNLDTTAARAATAGAVALASLG